MEKFCLNFIKLSLLSIVILCISSCNNTKNEINPVNSYTPDGIESKNPDRSATPGTPPDIKIGYQIDSVIIELSNNIDYNTYFDFSTIQPCSYDSSHVYFFPSFEFDNYYLLAVVKDHNLESLFQMMLPFDFSYDYYYNNDIPFYVSIYENEELIMEILIDLRQRTTTLTTFYGQREAPDPNQGGNGPHFNWCDAAMLIASSPWSIGVSLAFGNIAGFLVGAAFTITANYICH